MPRFGRRNAVNQEYATGVDSVLSARNLSALARVAATPRVIVLGLGVGRIAVGTVAMAAPVFSVRILGMDSASAKRASFLARMAAARDISLGAGTLAAGPTPRAVPWLLAGAGSDLVDAAVIGGALRTGATRGPAAAAITVGAGAAAVSGIWGAVRLRRAR